MSFFLNAKAHASFRVLSYNLQQGISLSRRRVRFADLREIIARLHVDVLLLQEVGSELGLGREADEAWEALADSAWPHSAYGRNAVFGDRHHGNAIASRLPFARWENVDLSFGGREKRSLLHAETATGLHFVSVHLGLVAKERRYQLAALAEHLATRVPQYAPLVVAGDFNDWTCRATPVLWRVLGLEEAHRKATGAHGRTFPSRFPVLPLDRVYFRGARLRGATRLRGAPWKRFSDHLPLLVELEEGGGA